MQQRMFKLWFTFTLMVTVAISAGAQREINYDESKVPQFDLPDVLTCQDGTAVTTKKQWEKKRRPELLRTFYSQEYGFTPEGKVTGFQVKTGALTEAERRIIVDGCLINYYRNAK